MLNDDSPQGSALPSDDALGVVLRMQTGNPSRTYLPVMSIHESLSIIGFHAF